MQYAIQAQGSVLEVGTAYGIATLSALEQGATVICNDLSPYHLIAVKQQACLRGLDLSRLNTIPGDFTSAIQLSPDSLESILMCRVLHFFDGTKIEYALKKAYQ